MKKLILLLHIALTTSAGFAQCDPATIDEIPTVYSKGYGASWKLTPEQDKYMTAIFTSVIEPSLKTTKGLKGNWTGLNGDWEYKGGFNATPDGLTSTTIQIYLPEMGCSKEKKIYTKDESGLVINFDLNSLHFIGEMSNVETYRNDKKVFIPNKIAGSQVYQIKQTTQTDKYDFLTFYRETDEGKYFLITKKEIPFFNPVTIKQALELSINNMLAEVAETKKRNNITGILDKEAWIKKDGVKPGEGLTTKQAQEVNDAGYQGYVEGSKAAVQQINFNLDSYKKSIEVVKEFLKITPPDILAKPATVNMLSTFYSSINDLKQLANDRPSGDFLVTINNLYLKKNLPKAAPQFICVEMRRQTIGAVTIKAFTNFEEALDFKKLHAML